jgi:bacteriorhodopsin
MNLTWITWGIGALASLVVVLALLLLLLTKRSVELIKNAPTTQLVLVVVLALLVLVIVSWIIRCMLLGGAQPQGYGETITLLSVFGGVGGGMHAVKRFTYEPTEPDGKDAEDVKPSATLPADLARALGGGLKPAVNTAPLNRGEADAP